MLSTNLPTIFITSIHSRTISSSFLILLLLLSLLSLLLLFIQSGLNDPLPALRPPPYHITSHHIISLIPPTGVAAVSVLHIPPPNTSSDEQWSDRHRYIGSIFSIVFLFYPYLISNATSSQSPTATSSAIINSIYWHAHCSSTSKTNPAIHVLVPPPMGFTFLKKNKKHPILSRTPYSTAAPLVLHLLQQATAQ